MHTKSGYGYYRISSIFIKYAIKALLIKCCFQCAAKAFFAMINHVGLRSNIKSINNVYEANTKNGANKDDLRKAVRFNYILAKIFAGVFMSAGLVVFFVPACVYGFTGLVIPILPVKFLFVPMDTVFGYIFHVIFHFFGLYNAVLGVMGFDIFMITTTIHIWPMTRILERTITNFNTATRSINDDSVKDSVWLKLQMRNIVLMHKEIYLLAFRFSLKLVLILCIFQLRSKHITNELPYYYSRAVYKSNRFNTAVVLHY